MAVDGAGRGKHIYPSRRLAEAPCLKPTPILKGFWPSETNDIIGQTGENTISLKKRDELRTQWVYKDELAGGVSLDWGD